MPLCRPHGLPGFRPETTTLPDGDSEAQGDKKTTQDIRSQDMGPPQFVVRWGQKFRYVSDRISAQASGDQDRPDPAREAGNDEQRDRESGVKTQDWYARREAGLDDGGQKPSRQYHTNSCPLGPAASNNGPNTEQERQSRPPVSDDKVAQGHAVLRNMSIRPRCLQEFQNPFQQVALAEGCRP